MNLGKVIWFTGLSGAGKSTLADMLYKYLMEDQKSVQVIDGDTLRNNQHRSLDFTPESININNNLVIDLCKKYYKNYDFIIVSVITPFLKIRKIARDTFGELYYEIYVKASIKKLIERDTKGLYKKALNGDIENMIGISSKVPYEIPVEPDIIIDTDTKDEFSSFKKLLSELYILGTI